MVSCPEILTKQSVSKRVDNKQSETKKKKNDMV